VLTLPLPRTRPELCNNTLSLPSRLLLGVWGLVAGLGMWNLRSLGLGFTALVSLPVLFQ
jgi:hypothetical protein